MAEDGKSFWLIEPIARPEDPRWQGRRIWRQVIVAAPSAAMARLIAEKELLEPDPATIGNESPSRGAGLTDEKLYQASRLDDPSIFERTSLNPERGIVSCLLWKPGRAR